MSSVFQVIKSNIFSRIYFYVENIYAFIEKIESICQFFSSCFVSKCLNL